MRRARTSAVFSWKPESNNQFILGGRGSLVMNAISAVRRAEDLGMPFSKDLWLWPVPHGPRGGSASASTRASTRSGSSRRTETPPSVSSPICASRRATRSQHRACSTSRPFPARRHGARSTRPPPRISGCRRASTRSSRRSPSKYTRNAGYPGHFNAAVQEVLETYLVPRMFAQVSQGRMTAAESVRATAAEATRIWKKWRKAGKI